jgi:hypothetical protein
MLFHTHGRGTNILGKEDVSLNQQLCECWTTSQLDNREFVPADCLQKILTEENIKDELATAGLVDNGLATFIHNRAPKTFLILVELEKTDDIERFHSYGFTDDYLPIVLNGPEISLSTGHEPDESSHEALRVFDGRWRSGPIHKFCKTQWGFMSPVLSDDMCRNGPLHEKTILPFDSKREEKISNFSKVSAFRIHDAHRPPGV